MSRYTNINISKSDNGRLYRKNAIYPNIPVTEDDIYVISTAGDRYDTLARQFYRDSSLWWIIAYANNHQRASLAVTPGVQLRIPADKNLAIELYQALNQ